MGRAPQKVSPVAPEPAAEVDDFASSHLTPELVLGCPRIAYRPKIAAAMIGVSKSTMFDLIKTGKIRARKAGAATIVLHKDLLEYVEALPFVDQRTAAQ